MSKLIKYLILFLAAFFIYCILFYKAESYLGNKNELDKREDNFNSVNTYFKCNNEPMKWEGHLKYASGPFYELNRIKTTLNLNQLLSNKDSIKTLKIDSQNFKELPEELFYFSNLEALDISDNPFYDLEKLINDLAKFPKLELLAMSHCGIKELPDNISLLDNLVGLSLDQNIEMIEVNENIGALKNLRYLNFRRNKKLKDLPKSIGKLKCLEQIIMSGAGFTNIVDELVNCTNLKNITANASKIKYLPDDFGKLKNLKVLNLGSNKIETLPESIGELEQLENLSLGSNEIMTLPKSITKLQNLDAIGLEYNRFKFFPLEVLKLKKLRLLKLHNNNIPSIPIELSKLPNLNLLYVDHEIISDDNIYKLKIKNPLLDIRRHDGLRRAPGEPKRKN